jgi:hypothetical protein
MQTTALEGTHSCERSSSSWLIDERPVATGCAGSVFRAQGGRHRMAPCPLPLSWVVPLGGRFPARKTSISFDATALCSAWCGAEGIRDRQRVWGRSSEGSPVRRVGQRLREGWAADGVMGRWRLARNSVRCVPPRCDGRPVLTHATHVVGCK